MNALNNRGNALLANQQFNDAIEDYSAAIEAAPKRPQAYYNRARAYTRLGETQGAIADFRRILELDAGSTLEARAREHLVKLRV